MPAIFFPFGELWSEFEPFLLNRPASQVTIRTWEQASEWDRRWWSRRFPRPSFTYEYTVKHNSTVATFAICPGECLRCGKAMVVGPSVTYTAYPMGIPMQQRRKGYPERCTDCARKDERDASRRTSARYRERNPKPPVEPRECLACGISFTPKRRDAQCCSGKCRAKLSRQGARVD